MELKLYKSIDLYRPIMFAAWPGMGNVAKIAMSYLRRELQAELFGEIDTTDSVSPEAVIIHNGILKLPHPPRFTFHYKKNPDIIIFEGDTQLHEKEGLRLIGQIIGVAKKFNVSKIFTGAAFPLPISYDAPSTVYGCATHKFLKEYLLNEYGIKRMDVGEISGLNGLLLGYAGESGIPAACLLATIPLYAINLPNPKASRAIIEIIETILEVRIDKEKLDIETKRVEKEMMEIEEKIRKEISSLQAPSSKDSSVEEGGRIPLEVRQKIERLFRKARQNKSQAYILKKELDKWNLFEMYEDRFLDLFKDH